MQVVAGQRFCGVCSKFSKPAFLTDFLIVVPNAMNLGESQILYCNFHIRGLAMAAFDLVNYYLSVAWFVSVFD